MGGQDQFETAEVMPPKLDGTSKTVRLQLVVPATWLEVVEEWRAKQRPVPNVSEAIRRLVQIAVKEESKKSDSNG